MKLVLESRFLAWVAAQVITDINDSFTGEKKLNHCLQTVNTT